MESSNKRFLIIEEALQDESGHWYEYTQSVIDLLVKNNFEVQVAAHINLKKNIIKNATTHPIFLVNAWSGIYKRGFLGLKRIVGFFKHNYLYYCTLSKFFNENQKFDKIFSPTLSCTYHLFAWFLLLIKFNKEKIPSLLLLIRHDIRRTRLSLLIAFIGLQLLRFFIKDKRVRLFTDSEQLASYYKQLTGYCFSTLPIPHINTEKIFISDVEKKIIRFVSLGPPRYEKGSDLILKALKKLTQKKTSHNFEFILQINDPRDLEKSFYEDILFLKRNQKIIFIEDALTREKYQSILLSADVIILPYRAQFYNKRTSGVAMEAISNGIPLIYTKDTWIESIVEKYGAGISIENEKIDSLIAAFYEMSKDFKKYKKISEENRTSLLSSEYSKENFLRSLLEIDKNETS